MLTLCKSRLTESTKSIAKNRLEKIQIIQKHKVFEQML